MLRVEKGMQIHLHVAPVDMRKAVNGLAAIVIDVFSQSPTSGDLFIFYNKGRDKLKCLRWDKNGFVIYYKRMEKHKFMVPKQLEEEHIEITSDQLQGLLAGFDFMLMKEFSDINYSAYY